MSSKMLLIFCDGTGMDGNCIPAAQSIGGDIIAVVENAVERMATNIAETMLLEMPVGKFPTNVVRLARSVKPRSGDKKQIVFYQSGVGTEANFAGDPVLGTTALQALGTAVASKIRDAYAFVAQNFEDGDEICIFGFSRGAYTARKLAGLIDHIGLLTRENLGQFFLIWRQLMDKHPTPTIPDGTRHPTIKCVGVWDTVGSVFDTIDALAFSDAELPATVEIALHAISLHENRKEFLPTLWSTPQEKLAPKQILKQVWFPGAHADVGGGYERRELQDIALFWMAGEITSFIDLDLVYLRSTRQPNPEPWGTSQPHNSYMETPFVERPVLGHETRLEHKDITKFSTFHQSLNFSPQQLVSPNYMTSAGLVFQQVFHPGFRPTYPPLNDFEAHCKENWDKQPIGAPTPIFGNPGNVIQSPVHWTVGTLGLLPPTAIEGGHEANGELLYIARAPYASGLHPGKASSQSMWISYGNKEIVISGEFERLVGDKNSVRWVHVDGLFSYEKLGGAVPVRGGREADGEPLLIAQASLKGGVLCGTVKYNNHGQWVLGTPGTLS
ncbi:uncharacterized protein EDB91DRAFT_1098085 [Suillus paluster]|uniref:uncharacterized protein n=1 Tax=Suillus paluster TaxID=48578 RepID=UPI001B886BA2|nr:uncharacterized protein EDB91DRAFT_1098085 [Suillus paluster]KAG1755267.1 hypothetical protein EDB91DRAFT_1098085 [Suillus paluster]